jgi:hypothetical protein
VSCAKSSNRKEPEASSSLQYSMAGGRPKGMEWNEFQIMTEKRGPEPPMVLCRHCIRFQKEFAGPPSAEIQGRIDRLRSHLRACVAYRRHLSRQPPLGVRDTTPSPAKKHDRTWTKARVDALHLAVARMQASLGLPVSFVSNPEFLEFVETLGPGTSRYLTSPKRLRKFVEEHREEIHGDSSAKSLTEL